MEFETAASLCAVDGRGQVRCTDADELPAPGIIALDIALAYWNVLVDRSGKVWRWDRPAAGQAVAMVEVPLPFAARRVGYADNGEVCVLGAGGELACGLVYQALRLIDVGATRFASIAFAPGAVWLLDTNGGLWCRGGGNCASLAAAIATPPAALDDPDLARRFPNVLDTPPAAALTHLADGVSRLWVSSAVCAELVATPGRGLCWSWGNPPRAEDLGAAEVVAIGPHTCRRSKDLYTCHRDPSFTYADTPATYAFTVRRARRAYQYLGRLCVDADGVLRCSRENPQTFDREPLETVVWSKRAP